MLKNFKERFAAFVLALAAYFAFGVQKASAALDLSTVTFSTTEIETYAVTIITALAVMWVIRKAIKTTNRS